jgi:hypothetical protein
LAVIGLLTAGLLLAGEDRQPPPAPSNDQLPALMLAKLASSQKIVSGLVSENYDEIRRGGEELIRICDATAWAGHDDQIYKHHRAELRRHGQKLLKMTHERNLDGAAFCYMQTLSTCISCHQYCRDVLKIAEDTDGGLRVVPIPVTDGAPRRLADSPVRR